LPRRVDTGHRAAVGYRSPDTFTTASPSRHDRKTLTEVKMITVLRLILSVLGLTVGASGFAAELQSAIDADYPSLEALYRQLHAHPELSSHEIETAKIMAQQARDAGLTVTEHVGGTGVVALLKNGAGPVVMIRTELDALPVEEDTGLPFSSHVRAKNAKGEEVPVAHACGHDLHMTVWTGTARRLVAERDHWSGTLIMIAQPAEETATGAKAMLADGLFTRFPRPDYNLSVHDIVGLPAGTIGLHAGPLKSAVDSLDLEIRGVGGHGALPQNTKDPIPLAAAIINALQTLVSRNNNPFEPAVVTVGSVHGGVKHNIIADSVKLEVSVRSVNEAQRKMLLDGIQRIAINEARAYGMPEDKMPSLKIVESTKVTYNSPKLVERLRPILMAAMGSAVVREGEPLMTSEDFSEYGWVEPRIPSAQIWLGAVDPDIYAKTVDKSTLPGTHSPKWAPDAEPTIKTGIMTLTLAALNLMAKTK
jgi:hippurate hydrolase